MEGNYRRVLDWWKDLFDSWIQSVATFYSSLLHTRVQSDVFTSCCLDAVSNDGRSPSLGFTNYPQPLLPTSNSNSPQRPKCSSSLTPSRRYVTTDGQSANLTWCQEPIRGTGPDCYYSQRVAGLLIWGAPSDKRTGLSFTIAAGPHQRSQFRFRI
jgi:hypothetical protein